MAINTNENNTNDNQSKKFQKLINELEINKLLLKNEQFFLQTFNDRIKYLNYLDKSYDQIKNRLKLSMELFNVKIKFYEQKLLRLKTAIEIVDNNENENENDSNKRFKDLQQIFN